MEELISKLKAELGELSASEEILFNELVVSMKIMEKARIEIEGKDLLTNITRSKDKDPYFQINRYVQIRNEQFKIFIKLFESMRLTPKEKSKQKEVKQDTINRLAAIKDKHNIL